jgi:Putative DnaT-like ssDNA binding protein
MDLKVEDGTGMPDAESYVAVADADAYWVKHQGPEWAAAPLEQKEAALRYSARWLDGHFAFIGQLLQFSQTLAWPRVQGLAFVDAFTEEGRVVTGVPTPIKEAQCELAMVHIKVFPLNLVTKPNSLKRSVSAGGVSIVYDNYMRGAVGDYINGLLRDYITGGGMGGVSSARIVRS